MGMAKHELEMKEEGWQLAAEAKGFRCLRCGGIPLLSEREVYFETGMCGYCAHVMNKDD